MCRCSSILRSGWGVVTVTVTSQGGSQIGWSSGHQWNHLAACCSTSPLHCRVETGTLAESCLCVHAQRCLTPQCCSTMEIARLPAEVSQPGRGCHTTLLNTVSCSQQTACQQSFYYRPARALGQHVCMVLSTFRLNLGPAGHAEKPQSGEAGERLRGTAVLPR